MIYDVIYLVILTEKLAFFNKQFYGVYCILTFESFLSLPPQPLGLSAYSKGATKSLNYFCDHHKNSRKIDNLANQSKYIHVGD